MTATPERPAARRTTTGTNIVALVVPADRHRIPHARHLLSSFAAALGASARVQHDIALAVSEAVTNAVLHGYGGDDPNAHVQIVADVEDGALEIVITDDGPGMRAAVPSEGLGLGLGLIARSASRFTVRDRDPHGTEVWMRFEL